MLVDIFIVVFNGEIDRGTKMANDAIVQVPLNTLNICEY